MFTFAKDFCSLTNRKMGFPRIRPLMKAVYCLRQILPVLLILIVTSGAGAQDSGKKNLVVKPLTVKVEKPFYDRRSLIIDSLSDRLMQMEIRMDSMAGAFVSQKQKLNVAVSEMEKLQKEKASLELKLKEAQGDNLQSSHTNSVLFIFNVGVGVFLLIALIWMFMRKRTEEEEAEKETELSAAPKRMSGHDDTYFDHKLDRIQKLGGLRDKGLLTDDEFNLQKKQILGE